jgi:hypothetical protein
MRNQFADQLNNPWNNEIRDKAPAPTYPSLESETMQEVGEIIHAAFTSSV